MADNIFQFNPAVTSNAETTTGNHRDEFFHHFARTSLVPAGGYLLILNGINSNRRVATAGGSVLPLELQAPRDHLYPLLSGVGTGNVFGTALAWRYRWKNSLTGEVSALSPLPDVRLNVGTEAIDGGNEWLGQKAYFTISTSDAPPGADTLQVFRNTSEQLGLFYLADEATFTAGSTTTLKLEDNIPDVEIVFEEAVRIDTQPAPSWAVGRMPPVAKAYTHPNGRVMYYGQIRMGAYSTGSYTVTTDSHLLTPALGAYGSTNLSPFIRSNRVGQRIVPVKSSGGTAILDPNSYRIVEVTHGPSLYVNYPYVYPAIAENSTMTSSSVTMQFNIFDDRDLRTIYWSEPGLPTQIDPFKAVAVGVDKNDSPCLITGFNGYTYIVTGRKVYRVTNDSTEDPSLTMFVAPVADEGASGLWAACWTPFGICYLHEELGPRIFNGSVSGPLGGESAVDEFPAIDQFHGLEKSLFDQAVMWYDTYNHKVVLGNVFMAGSDLEVWFEYDPESGIWRGPHKGSRYVEGELYTTAKAKVFCFGDGYGNLSQDDRQELEQIVPTTHTLTGTATSVENNVLVKDTGGVFDPNSDKRLRGVPVWMSDGSSYYYSVVADILDSGLKLRLAFPPVTLAQAQGTPAIGWTYSIGAIYWYAETAYLDAGEPIQPKTVKKMRLRWERPSASGTDSFSVGVDAEDSGTFTTETGSEATVDPTSKVYGEPRLGKNGVCHKLRLHGLSRTGHPKITAAMVDMDVRSGVRRNP